MCITCGCSGNNSVVYTDPQSGKRIEVAKAGAAAFTDVRFQPLAAGMHTHADVTTHSHEHSQDEGHIHHHDHDHAAEHAALHSQTSGTTVSLERDILAKNQLLAERNRGWFAGRGILALNLVSSPGSGKTTLLERTIRDLKGKREINVIEGDQATVNDAERIRDAGCRAIQINTGAGCHLEAEMLAKGLDVLAPAQDSVVMIENVGNLVCPALFDLGERAKVVILSTTEGEDKPIKYPHMFRASSVMLLNKIDLLPHLRFDVERCLAYAREANPKLQIFCVSAQTGEGMEDWYDWIESQGGRGQVPIVERDDVSAQT